MAMLAGCHNLGYNTQSANNALTPNVSQTEYTRTWQPTPGQPGQNSQNVTTGVPAATVTDPANPNYISGAPSPPPATTTAH